MKTEHSKFLTEDDYSLGPVPDEDARGIDARCLGLYCSLRYYECISYDKLRHYCRLRACYFHLLLFEDENRDLLYKNVPDTRKIKDELMRRSKIKEHNMLKETL